VRKATGCRRLQLRQRQQQPFDTNWNGVAQKQVLSTPEAGLHLHYSLSKEGKQLQKSKKKD